MNLGVQEGAALDLLRARDPDTLDGTYPGSFLTDTERGMSGADRGARSMGVISEGGLFSA